MEIFKIYVLRTYILNFQSLSSIDLNQAATLKITEHQYPVITAYELGLLLFSLIVEGSIRGQELRLRTKVPERRHYRQVLNFFTSYGVLQVPSKTVFSILGKDEDTPAEPIVCRVDPFAYLSHLSAMEFYGLTDRISQTLYASSPGQTEWKSYAGEKMKKDLGKAKSAYFLSDFPKLTRTRMRKIRQKTISIFYRRHLGAFRSIKSTGIRVSTIGRTFLDMLREPDLCGGIRHVLAIYKESASDNLQLIIDDIDKHGSNIDKVRAGYVLTELVGIEHPTVVTWKRFAQRGGSRKLYAKNDYSANYSADWCLSLNVD